MLNVYKGLFGYESGAFRVPLEVDTEGTGFSNFEAGKWVKLDNATNKYVLATASDSGDPTLIQLFEGANLDSVKMSEVLGGVEGIYYGETDKFAGAIAAKQLLTINNDSVLVAASSGDTAVAVAVSGVVNGKIKFKVLPNRPTVA